MEWNGCIKNNNEYVLTSPQRDDLRGQWTETDRTWRESSREFKELKDNKKETNNEMKGAKQAKAAKRQASARANTYYSITLYILFLTH